MAPFPFPAHQTGRADFPHPRHHPPRPCQGLGRVSAAEDDKVGGVGDDVGGQFSTLPRPTFRAQYPGGPQRVRTSVASPSRAAFPVRVAYAAPPARRSALTPGRSASATSQI